MRPPVSIVTTEPAASRPTGLALSAGGARGAYQIGCWRALRERGIRFDAIAGSSIGALNGALICQDDWDKALQAWDELGRARIFRPDFRKLYRLAGDVSKDVALLLTPLPNIRGLRFMKYAAYAYQALSTEGSLRTLARDGLFSMDPFLPVVQRHLDMARVLDSPTDLFISAYAPPEARRPWGRSTCFPVRDMDPDEAWKALSASMSLPLLFPAIELQGKRFMDGGMGDWLPIRPLIEHGCDRVIAIGLKPQRRVARSLRRRAHITLICPEKPLGRFPIATFQFSRDAVAAWIEQGYEDACRVLDAEGETAAKRQGEGALPAGASTGPAHPPAVSAGPAWHDRFERRSRRRVRDVRP